MKRKVVKHGINTLTVSLPAKWVKNNNIRQGNELFLKEAGKEIIIRPLDFNISEDDSPIIEINNKNEYIRRPIIANYVKGANSIKIKSNDRSVLNLIQNDLFIYFLGFEIIEQKEGSFTLKYISKGIEEELDTMFRRLILITQSMLKDIHMGLLNKDDNILKEVIINENHANRITLFCKRMLNVSGYKPNIFPMYSMCGLLEQITDESKYLSEYFIEKQIKIDNNFLDYLSKVIEQFELFYKMIRKYSSEDLIKIKAIEKNLTNKKHDLISKNDPILAHYLTAIQNKIHHITEEALVYSI